MSKFQDSFLGIFVLPYKMMVDLSFSNGLTFVVLMENCMKKRNRFIVVLENNRVMHGSIFLDFSRCIYHIVF